MAQFQINIQAQNSKKGMTKLFLNLQQQKLAIVFFCIANIQVKFNSLMLSFYREKSKQRPFQKQNKNKSAKIEEKPLHFTRLKIEEIKIQVIKLKYLHYDLIKYVKQFINKLPEQMQTYCSDFIQKKLCFGKIQSQRQKLTTNQKAKVNTQTLKKQNCSYESKLKIQDHKIKATILKSLQTLKELENKENCLRQVNQKHKSLRKSLSKQSFKPKNNSRKFGSHQANASVFNEPENYSNTSQKLSPLQHPLNQFSPSFFHKQEDKNFDISFHQTFQEKSIFINKQKLVQDRFTVLKCQSGHQYYQGGTVNLSPHGNGKFTFCCHKMPLQISSKIVKYEGEFINGQFDGQGTLICKGDVRFEGHFSKGMRHGQGIIFLEKLGQRGLWQNDQLITFL